MLYYEILRKGMAAESILSEDSERNIKLTRELTFLHYYGILGNPGK